jgi:rhomboid protease GluP
LVGGFRLPPGTAARHKLQTNSLQVLIPSLLPLASATSIGHIDYGAHFGGALSGALAAAVLLKFWPATQRIPQLWTVAAGVSIVGALLFVISAAIAVGNFSKYSVKLIPPAEMPTNAAEGETRAAALVARYPGDPRSHLYLGLALDATKDVAGAERKLRAALASAQALSAMFEPQLELNVRGVLAAFLMDQGRANEAKEVAHSVCAAPAGEKGIESMLKILVDQHLCD